MRTPFLFVSPFCLHFSKKVPILILPIAVQITAFAYKETIVRFKMIDEYGLKGALISHLPKNLYETRQCLEVFFFQTARQERLLVEYLRELNLEYF
jgi:hypothetical protein